MKTPETWWSAALLATVSFTAFNACRTAREMAAPDPLEDLIAKNTLARGGAEAIESARTVAIRLRIVEPKFTVEGLYQASRDGRMRIEVFAEGKRVFSEGYDGRRGWQLVAGAEHATDSGPPGEAALRRGLELPTNLRGLHEMRQRGHRVALVSRELIGGVNFHVLELKLQDGITPEGFTTFVYLNPVTYMIERQRDFRALHPAVDPSQKWIEQRYDDFRKVDRRMVSFKSSQVDAQTGQIMQTTTILEVQTNPPLTDRAFARP